VWPEAYSAAPLDIVERRELRKIELNCDLDAAPLDTMFQR
jgi:hypothetical protein